MPSKKTRTTLFLPCVIGEGQVVCGGGGEESVPKSIFFLGAAGIRIFEVSPTDKHDTFLNLGFKHGKKWVGKNRAKCNMGFGPVTKNTLLRTSGRLQRDLVLEVHRVVGKCLNQDSPPQDPTLQPGGSEPAGQRSHLLHVLWNPTQLRGRVVLSCHCPRMGCVICCGTRAVISENPCSGRTSKLLMFCRATRAIFWLRMIAFR